ncbi:MAG: HAD family phosphatase [Bacilli bacterium]|nr:HAD family phosphatase [Bacilli bacterium]
MIRNLIFDVGNVLTWWDPKKFCRTLFPNDPALAEKIAEKAFLHPRWFEGDTGDTTMEALAASITEKEEEAFIRSTIYAFTHFPEALIINEPMVAFLKEAKKKGYHVYLLSNYCELFERSIRHLGCLEDLDGYIYSHKEKIRKPDLGIYRLLLNRYHLNPTECLFIDDKSANVKAGLEAGYGYGFVYQGNDEELFEYVKRNGLFG